jgi:hypothetical protein
VFKVQEYLRSGKTLEDLETEYSVTGSVNEQLGVVSLNYSQISSDLSQEICQECRGLILELNTWNVASRSFHKFFNLEEPQGQLVNERFDWNSAVVLDKVDGSLIQMYHYNGDWHVATRKDPMANGPVGSFETTFRELVFATMEEMKFSFDELSPEYFYSFELTTPLNVIVVPYNGHNLTFLAAWKRDTLEEVPLIEMPELTAKKVKRLPLTNIDEVLKYIEVLSPVDGEGVVLLDKHLNRIKVKSAEYLKAFRAVMTAEASPRNRVEILLSDSYDDIYGLLPSALQKQMSELQEKLQRFLYTVQETYNQYKDIESQKDFALAIKHLFYSSWLFNLRKGLALEEVIKKTHIDTVVGMLEKFEIPIDTIEDS